MKKGLLLLCMLPTALSAQVKLGDNTAFINTDALLELESTSKGFVLPRLTSIQMANILTPPAGMVLFNTDSNCIAQRTATSWEYLNGKSNGWSLSGNTADENSFLGTTNQQNLVFKTNNSERMLMDTLGRVGIGLSEPVARLHLSGNLPAGAIVGVKFNAFHNITNNTSVQYGMQLYPGFTSSITSNATPQLFGLTVAPFYNGDLQRMIAISGQASFSGSNTATTITGVNGAASHDMGTGSVGEINGGFFDASNTVANVLVTEVVGSRNRAKVNAGTVSKLSASYNLAQGFSAGNVSEMAASRNIAEIDFGGINVSSIYGNYNQVFASEGSVNSVYGTYNAVNTGLRVKPVNGYGVFASISGDSIANVYSFYAAPVGVTTTATNARGLYIGNIASPAGVTGIRRAIEYAAVGSNGPFVVTGTGNVGIGTLNPPSNARLAIRDGHIQVSQTTAPLIAATLEAGTGALATLANASDMAGKISLTTGNGSWTAGTQASVTFNRVYNSAPIVSLTPANAAAAAAMATSQVYVNSTTTGFSIVFGQAATSGSVMQFHYQVIEGQ